MEQEGVIFHILKSVGAIITNSHIVYTSGKHGSAYVNKDAVYPYVRETANLCWAIALRFGQMDQTKAQVVIGPAIGGVVLSQWTAYKLNQITGEEVLSVYSEKAEDGSFVIKRGYDKLIAGKNVLVVEDVLTTGSSAKKVVEAVRAIGGKVVGLGVICNRGGITTKDVGDVPVLFSLTSLKLDMWDEEECPLCAQGVPINTDVGKGREYLARKQR